MSPPPHRLRFNHLLHSSLVTDNGLFEKLRERYLFLREPNICPHSRICVAPLGLNDKISSLTHTHRHPRPLTHGNKSPTRLQALVLQVKHPNFSKSPTQLGSQGGQLPPSSQPTLRICLFASHSIVYPVRFFRIGTFVCTYIHTYGVNQLVLLGFTSVS